VKSFLLLKKEIVLQKQFVRIFLDTGVLVAAARSLEGASNRIWSSLPIDGIDLVCLWPFMWNVRKWSLARRICANAPVLISSYPCSSGPSVVGFSQKFAPQVLFSETIKNKNQLLIIKFHSPHNKYAKPLLPLRAL